MQAPQWDNRLAVRLPAAVVDTLGLKAGDEIEISIPGKRDFKAAGDPMNVRPFLDTNVIIYSFREGDPRNQTFKEPHGGGRSDGVQVLNQFVAITRRKLGFRL
jgi:hypothetical protein